MISDVLYDAKQSIEEFMGNFPELYDPLEKQILLVLAGMDWLRADIDNQLGEEEQAHDVDLHLDGDVTP